MRDRVDLVKLLILYGADTKHQDMEGRIALKWAKMIAKLDTQESERDTQGDENCQKLIEDAIKTKESKQTIV